jgi:thiol-disulfide isomerase/thioredoxin
MLKFTRFAIVVSVTLLALTTACSQSEQSHDTSTASKVALASHLKQIGAKFYGTFWCPYCKQQKEMFSQQAFSQINYIECDPQGKNAQTDLCEKANIESFPTWEIKGRLYKGLKSWDELADLSDYKGDRNFKN